MIATLIIGVISWYSFDYYQLNKMNTVIKQAKTKVLKHYRRNEKMNLDLTEPFPAVANGFTNSMRDVIDVLWTFTDKAPASYAGKNLFLSDEQCFTDIVEVDGCTKISTENMTRLKSLRQAYLDSLADEEKQEKAKQDNVRKLGNTACENWLAQMPDDYELFYLWPAYGRVTDLGYQVKGDERGGTTKMVEVQVNYPKKPVILVLKNDNTLVWKISYTEQTNIAGVWAAGRYPQVVVGVDKNTPVLTTSYMKPACKKHIGDTLPLPRILKSYDEQHISDGKIRIGRYTDNWISHGNIESLKKNPETERLSGELGIQQLVKEGAITPITNAELAKIREKQGKTYSYYPERANEIVPRSYVIKKPMTFPKGLYGGHSVDFYFLDESIPLPKGDMGHCQLTTSFGYCVRNCY